MTVKEYRIVDKSELERYDSELENIISSWDFEEYSKIEDALGRTIIWCAKSKLDFYSGDDFGFKGGVARSALKQFLGIVINEKLRDIDALLLSSDAEAPTSWEVDDEFHINNSIEDFLASRDITQNEVLLLPDGEGNFELFATSEAIIDTLYNIYCPSFYERAGDLTIRSRIATRLLRFAAESIHRKEHPKIVLRTSDIRSIYIFDLALQFERAASKDCASEYSMLCINFELVPDHITNTSEMFEWLKQELDNYHVDFTFNQSITKKIIDQPDNLLPIKKSKINKLLNKYPKLSLEDFVEVSY